MNFELQEKIVVNGSPDNASAIYVNKEDLLRRLFYGWTLKEIVEFALEEKEIQFEY